MSKRSMHEVVAEMKTWTQKSKDRDKSFFRSRAFGGLGQAIEECLGLEFDFSYAEYTDTDDVTYFFTDDNDEAQAKVINNIRNFVKYCQDEIPGFFDDVEVNAVRDPELDGAGYRLVGMKKTA